MSAVVLTAVALIVCGWMFDTIFLKTKRSPLAVLPGPPSDHAILGNMVASNGPEKRKFWKYLDETYGGVVRLHSLIGMQWQITVSDPEAIHSILVTNGQIWPRLSVVNTFNNLFFGKGLVTVAGEAHRRQRKTISPIFSTRQMHAFLPKFYDISRTLCNKIKNDITTSGSDEITLDALRFTSQIALDIVGNSAIGWDFNTINQDSEYSRAVKQLLPAAGELGPVLLLLSFLSKLGPWSLRKMFMEVVMPWLGAFGATCLRILHIIDILEAESLKIFSEKKREIENGDFDDDGPKDVLATLLRGSKAGVEDALDEPEILGQIQTMVFAGHETTSTVLTKCLQELAQNQNSQEKLRLEFAQARLQHGEGDLDHDVLQALPFLDALVRETLRLYPPFPAMARQNTEDTILPLAVPIKTTTGEYIKQVFVPKGTAVTLAIDRMNRSKLLFGEDAEEFRPERWLPGESGVDSNVKNPAVYSSILTFSGGFRSCIGYKFAVLELKVVIYSLINNFAFSSAYPDEEIIWQATTGLFPLIKGQESRGPQLPIKIRPL